MRDDPSDPGYVFDLDTTLVPEADGWSGCLPERWLLDGRPNGGFLLALSLRTMARSLSVSDPITATGQFLAPVHLGPFELHVETLRAGRRHASALSRLSQDGELRMITMATFADLERAVGSTLVTTPAPARTPLDECRDLRAADDPRIASQVMQELDVRVEPVGWTSGRRGGSTRCGGWARFDDGRPVDVASLPLFCDAFPPSVLDALRARHIPTLELTIHVHARPVAGPLYGRFVTGTVVNGYLTEEGELWDAGGSIVATSRQRALAYPAQTDGR